MGILQIYEADGRGVVSTRVCPLPDCQTAVVRKQVNGEYSLTATLPAGAVNINEAVFGRAIKAITDENGTEQYFIIKRRRRSLTGGLEIYAEHQSYYYSGAVVRGSAASNRYASLALYGIINAAKPSVTDLCDWSFMRSRNPQILAAAVTQPTPLRSLVLGWLIENYGGEIDWDGFNLTWADQLGSDRGAFYRYGANMNDMEAEDILDNYVTGIYPYWGSIDPATNLGIVTIDDVVLDYPGAWPHKVYKPVNLTDKFETQPTSAQLKSAAQDWMTANPAPGIPMSIRASRVRIYGDTPVGLGDTVRIVNTPWGIDTKTRVMALTFDALRGAVDNVELGNINPGFAGAVKNTK